MICCDLVPDTAFGGRLSAPEAAPQPSGFPAIVPVLCESPTGDCSMKDFAGAPFLLPSFSKSTIAGPFQLDLRWFQT